jgi:hypothetical protein
VDGYTCSQARADAYLYKVVKITGYTQADLEQTDAEFIARLMRADGPYQEAQHTLNQRAAKT